MPLYRSFKKAWLEALRSGKYPQGKQNLENIDGTRCCLGVACDVAGIEKRIPTPSYSGGKPLFYEYHFNEGWNECYNMAEKLKEDSWLCGVVPAGMWGLDHEEIERLWHMNDRDGKTFSEIADYIENEIEEIDDPDPSPTFLRLEEQRPDVLA